MWKKIGGKALPLDEVEEELVEVNHELVSEETYEKIKSIIQAFPVEGLVHVCAYGSGVFPQVGRELGDMIDLILVVEDSVQWHSKNLEANYNHYSSFRLLGAAKIAWIQDNLACGIYYNTYAEINGCVVKYGVITAAVFEEDLTQWKYMYVAGRLQKPVLHFPMAPVATVRGFKWLRAVLAANRERAFEYSMMYLPEVFTKLELYVTIAGLSYQGDSRLLIGGEDPGKVDSIVVPLINAYDKIYGELLRKSPCMEGWYDSVLVEYTKMYRTDGRYFKQLQELPPSLQIKLVEHVKAEGKSMFSWPRLLSKQSEVLTPKEVRNELIKLSYRHEDIPDILSSALTKIVFRASLRQTLVGFLSTGFVNSLYYAYEKLMKTTKLKKAFIKEQVEIAEESVTEVKDAERTQSKKRGDTKEDDPEKTASKKLDGIEEKVPESTEKKCEFNAEDPESLASESTREHESEEQKKKEECGSSRSSDKLEEKNRAKKEVKIGKGK